LIDTVICSALMRTPLEPGLNVGVAHCAIDR
jgi:hypothetical protein